ncbi:MAG: CDP-alcohol phosphatidyltransferase family protein, partial [Clostridia bacterium]|nr:CDP-alcohol phosphatidyltransferase family protein [Clostridia bacterium]
MSIPNILSIFRLVLIPFFTYYIVVKDNFLVAGILLVISGVTDYFDGYIARKFNMKTNLGKILDPLADKLTQLIAVICLAIKGYAVMWFLAVFLFLKDLSLLIGGIMLYQKKDGMVPSN